MVEGSKFPEKCCPWLGHLVGDLDISDVGKGGWKDKDESLWDIWSRLQCVTRPILLTSELFFYFLNFMSKFLLNVPYDTDSGIQLVSHILNRYDTSSAKSISLYGQCMSMYDICTNKKRYEVTCNSQVKFQMYEKNEIKRFEETGKQHIFLHYFYPFLLFFFLLLFFSLE